MSRCKIIIMGAAGRDFHNFNVCFKNNKAYQVVAFTAAQIPYISDRKYPASLAGRLYPSGIPIYPEGQLAELIRKHKINQVIFAYSDVSHEELMHKASAVIAMGADFRLIGPDATMLKSRRPVISICAVRTGCGKSEIARYLCDILLYSGIKPVVVRHPMPYGDLALQEVERFSDYDDLLLHRCSIEEREEFEPLLRHGAVVYAGVDYGKIIRLAEQESDIIIWDGGNNDFPFFRPDLEITVVDPLRAGDETSYFPGEVNLRRADLIVINKINAASTSQIAILENVIPKLNPRASVLKTESTVTIPKDTSLHGKSVLIVEDGPTITHGGMPAGAGLVAAHKFKASNIIDPRPFVTGSIAQVFNLYPHIGPVLPAMGYSASQLEDLRQSMENTPCDIILSATPFALNRLISISKPLVQVSYDITELPGDPLKCSIMHFLSKIRP